MMKILPLLLCFLATAAPQDEPCSHGEPVVVSGTVGEKIDEYLTAASDFGFSGTVLVAQEGKIILQKGYGFANVDTRTPNTPDTIMDVASLTKQFTATAVLKLEETGRLKVGDAIHRYLPDVPPDRQDITIHQLLTHTSGLRSDLTRESNRRMSRDETVAQILATPLSSPPGAKFEYSNIGYVLLAAIIERASGRPYQEFLRKELFQPAGLKHTGFIGELPECENRYARSYSGFYHDDGDPDAGWDDLGASGVWSTTGDLYRWDRALRGSAVLSSTDATRLFERHAENYGYGWEINGEDDDLVIEHGGTSNAYTSSLRHFVKDDLVVIAFSNVRPNVEPFVLFGSRIIPRIVREGSGLPIPKYETKAEHLNDFTGRFELEPDNFIIFDIFHGRLVGGAQGQMATDLLAHGAEAVALIGSSDRSAIELVQAIRNHNIPGIVPFLAEDTLPDQYARELIDEWENLVEKHGRYKGYTSFSSLLNRTSGGVQTFFWCEFENQIVPIRFFWKDEQVIGNDTYMPYSAMTFFQPAGKDAFVGYNLAFRHPINVQFARDKGGKVTRVIFEVNNHSVPGRRADKIRRGE